MAHILTDLSPATLTDAIRHNLYEFFHFFQRAPQTEWVEDTRWLRWRTPVLHPWFNGVLARQLPAEGDEPWVAETVAYFRSYDQPSFTWWLQPHLPPDSWDRYLRPQGLRPDANTPGLAIELAALREEAAPLADFCIVPVEDQATLQTWTRTLVQGYELPQTWEHDLFHFMAGLGLDFPMRNYLGYLGDQPVATANGFYAAGVVGVQFIATLPAARRKGIGARLTLAPLLEARQRGYRAGILQASEMGYPVYERLGFQKLCAMQHYFWHAEAEEL